MTQRRTAPPPVNLNERLDLTVPYARTVNPIFQPDSEDAGVKPHIETEASQAPERARDLAAAGIQTRRGTPSNP